MFSLKLIINFLNRLTLHVFYHKHNLTNLPVILTFRRLRQVHPEFEVRPKKERERGEEERGGGIGKGE